MHFIVRFPHFHHPELQIFCKLHIYKCTKKNTLQVLNNRQSRHTVHQLLPELCLHLAFSDQSESYFSLITNTCFLGGMQPWDGGGCCKVLYSYGISRALHGVVLPGEGNPVPPLHSLDPCPVAREGVSKCFEPTGWSACNVFLTGSPELHNQTYSESPVQVGGAGAAAVPGEHQGFWWPLATGLPGPFQALMPGR